MNVVAFHSDIDGTRGKDCAIERLVAKVMEVIA